MQPDEYIAFSDLELVGRGPLQELLPILKARFDQDPSDASLVFRMKTGAQVDFDLRGSVDEVLARAEPSKNTGRGRPKLGVKSREISLLPRHWEWLAEQPSGSSAALRRLVDQAIKEEPDKQKAQRIRVSLTSILSALAGNYPNFEDLCRSLYAGDGSTVDSLTTDWPKDLRNFAIERCQEASRLESCQ